MFNGADIPGATAKPRSDKCGAIQFGQYTVSRSPTSRIGISPGAVSAATRHIDQSSGLDMSTMWRRASVRLWPAHLPSGFLAEQAFPALPAPDLIITNAD